MESLTRRVERVIEPQTVLEGAGVALKRSIATRTLDYVDPFLLFDHFGSDNPDDYVAGWNEGLDEAISIVQELKRMEG